MELTDIQSKLNEIPCINAGGCAIASLVMYRWLKKENKLAGDEKFIYLYNYESGLYFQNQKALEDDSIIPTSASHICLYHDGRYIDSKGTVFIDNWKCSMEIEPGGFIIRSINNVDDWNEMFTRSDILPLIDELEIEFDDILI